MLYFLYFIIAVIGTEAITEILVKSELFEPLHKFLHSRTEDNKVFKFLHALLDCGYCTSVWIAFFLFMGFLLIPNTTFAFCLFLAIHRCANVWHFIIDRIHGLERI